MKFARKSGLKIGLLIAVLAGTATAAPPLREPSEIESLLLGRELAQRNCGMCHSLADKGPSPSAKAPPFRDLYKRMDVEALGEGLTQGILTQHPAMPEFRFQPNELVALVRYLRTMQALQTTSLGARGRAIE